MLRFLDVVGYISTVVVVTSIAWGGVLWARGILPVLYRLGNGLAKRRIAVLAGGDSLTSLTQLLTDSRLFAARNIISVAGEADLGRAEGAAVLLVYWPQW